MTSAPSVLKFFGDIPGDTDIPYDNSLQVVINTPATLEWEVSNADSVKICGGEFGANPDATPAGDDGKGKVTITPTQDLQDYTLVALSGDQSSSPKVVHVSTHPADECVSQHCMADRGPQVLEFSASYTVRDGSTRSLQSLAGSCADHKPQDGTPSEIQHYSRSIKTLNFSWKVSGYSNAVVDLVPLFQPKFQPDPAAARSDTISKITSDGCGAVSNFDWLANHGWLPSASLYIELRLLDATDKTKLLGCRSILAFTDNEVGQINFTVKEDPDRFGLAVHWMVEEVGDAPAYLVAFDPEMNQVGERVQLRQRGSMAKTGNSTFHCALDSLAGSYLTLEAAVLGQPGDGNATVIPAFQIAGEGNIVTSCSVHYDGPPPPTTIDHKPPPPPPPPDTLIDVNPDPINAEKKTWKTSVEITAVDYILFKKTDIKLGQYFTADVEVHLKGLLSAVQKVSNADVPAEVETQMKASQQSIELVLRKKADFNIDNVALQSTVFDLSPLVFEKDSSGFSVSALKGGVEMTFAGGKAFGSALALKGELDLTAAKLSVDKAKKSQDVKINAMTLLIDGDVAWSDYWANIDGQPTAQELADAKAGNGVMLAFTGELELKFVVAPTEAFYEMLAEKIDAMIAAGGAEAFGVALAPVGAVLGLGVGIYELNELWDDSAKARLAVPIVNLQSAWYASGFIATLATYSGGSSTPNIADPYGVEGLAGAKSKFVAAGTSFADTYKQKQLEHNLTTNQFKKWQSANPDASAAQTATENETELKAIIAAALDRLFGETTAAIWPQLADDLYLHFEVGKSGIADGAGQADQMFHALYPGFFYSYNPRKTDAGQKVFAKGISQAFIWKDFRSDGFPPRLTEPEAEALWHLCMKADGGPLPTVNDIPFAVTPDGIAQRAQQKVEARKASADRSDQAERVRAWLVSKDQYTIDYPNRPPMRAIDYFTEHADETNLLDASSTSDLDPQTTAGIDRANLARIGADRGHSSTSPGTWKDAADWP